MEVDRTDRSRVADDLVIAVTGLAGCFGNEAACTAPQGLRECAVGRSRYSAASRDAVACGFSNWSRNRRPLGDRTSVHWPRVTVGFRLVNRMVHGPAGGPFRGSSGVEA